MTFWYGMPFEAVANLPSATFSAYMNGLPARMAEFKLMLSEVVAMPHMKESDRKNMIRSWREAANIVEYIQPATPAMLALLGIGVRHGKSRRSGT